MDRINWITAITVLEATRSGRQEADIVRVALRDATLDPRTIAATLGSWTADELWTDPGYRAQLLAHIERVEAHAANLAEESNMRLIALDLRRRLNEAQGNPHGGAAR